MRILILIYGLFQRIETLLLGTNCRPMETEACLFYDDKLIGSLLLKFYNFQFNLVQGYIWFLCKTNLARLSLNGACFITR